MLNLFQHLRLVQKIIKTTSDKAPPFFKDVTTSNRLCEGGDQAIKANLLTIKISLGKKIDSDRGNPILDEIDCSNS